MVTFESAWEFVKWAAIPGIGGLCFWIYDLQTRHRIAVSDLYSRLSAEREARAVEAKEHRGEWADIRKEFSEALRALHSDVTAWKLDATVRFATAETMERGFSKMGDAITALGNRFERYFERDNRGKGNRNVD